jgi:hypothetical protein
MSLNPALLYFAERSRPLARSENHFEPWRGHQLLQQHPSRVNGCHLTASITKFDGFIVIKIEI